MTMKIIVIKGGTGSGFEDHAGRPGKVGGSRGRGSTDMSPEAVARREKLAAAKRRYTERTKSIRESCGYNYDKMVALMDSATDGKFSKIGKPLEEFLFNAYEYQDENTGLYGKIKIIKYDEDTEDITITGTIHNTNSPYSWEEFGKFTRTINVDGEVHHDYFTITPSQENKGFGSLFKHNRIC